MSTRSTFVLRLADYAEACTHYHSERAFLCAYLAHCGSRAPTVDVVVNHDPAAIDEVCCSDNLSLQQRHVAHCAFRAPEMSYDHASLSLLFSARLQQIVLNMRSSAHAPCSREREVAIKSKCIVYAGATTAIPSPDATTLAYVQERGLIDNAAQSTRAKTHFVDAVPDTEATTDAPPLSAFTALPKWGVTKKRVRSVYEDAAGSPSVPSAKSLCWDDTDEFEDLDVTIVDKQAIDSDGEESESDDEYDFGSKIDLSLGKGVTRAGTFKLHGMYEEARFHSMTK